MIEESNFNSAKVKVRTINDSVIIPVASKKPNVSDLVIQKWQNLVDLFTKIAKVPSGLIMHIRPEDIEVFISSKTDGNPYEVGASEHLGKGLYCETVVGTRKILKVPDAREDPMWEDNPDVPLCMYSYLGVPIQWPDGEIFGTICLLDSKKNCYTKDLEDLIIHFKEVVELDLKILCDDDELKARNVQQELKLSEAHHRIKNHFMLILSLIQLEKDELRDLGKVDAFVEALSRRIKSLALLHEKLYKTKNYEEMYLGKYIKEMSIDLLQSMAGFHVDFGLTCDGIRVNPDAMTTVALIVNELVTNSIKYAFEDNDEPKIFIALRHEGDKWFMTYRDNGPGISKESFYSDTLGQTLIRELPSQLDGCVTFRNDNGAVFEFEFSLTPKG